MFELQTNDPPGENKGDQAAQYIPMSDVAKHHLAQDCWVVVDGKVYDHHPGGSQIIVQNGGRDVTSGEESFMSARTINYYGAASLDGYSMAENRGTFRKCRLLPRIMRDVLSVRPQTTIFGIESALPIYVSPSSNALLGHPDGELNITRGTTSKMNGAKGETEPGIRTGPFTATPPYHDARLNWNDLPRLKDLAGGVPIYLKGDVRLAKAHGLAGCILSNHGGRQLDQARTGFDSLRSIHAEDPQLVKDIEIYIDGGIRRGTDVLQALAFGARGVGLGRPFLYAQAAYGESGVIRAVRILENEIVTAMRLLGLTSLEQITPDMVECLQEIWR
ncbi:hypothetical protein IAR55_005984 [Kwoniella newhampshirensis]|uniref:L-lactate dehydrogenase (Cytochrome) n=1 Tax=Kwoniella newhampshirensis TaxID=1651941 RepID=A0AAW0YHT1_9TREE